MSDDRQGTGWWLASDGKWYPPDLRPAGRPAAGGEQARIAALLDAAIGVAQVQNNVFAKVHGEGRSGTFSSSDRGGSRSDAQHGGGDDRSAGQGTGVRRGTDSLPRFRGPERPSWPFEARSPSEPVMFALGDPVAAGPGAKAGDQATAIPVALRGRPTSRSAGTVAANPGSCCSRPAGPEVEATKTNRAWPAGR